MWNGIIISKTIRFPYVYYFNIISCVEALGLVHTYVGCTDSLYAYIQWLLVQLNSYTLTVYITERSFVVILYWVKNISPLLIWRICHTWTFKNRFHIVSTCIHVYISLLIWKMWHRKLTRIVTISYSCSHPVYVLIHA